MGSLVEILEVEKFELPPDLFWGFNIDIPSAGDRFDARAIKVGGWVLPKRSRARLVRFVQHGAIIHRTSASVVRPDVHAVYPDVPAAARCGFDTFLPLGSQSKTEIDAQVVYQRRPYRLGTIRGRRYWREPRSDAFAQLVSVVIPCHNQAHFLGEAIESALNQTYPHIEVIVVDDGSSDNTGAVAARYPMVRYVRQENLGVAAARNTGLRASNGNYLVFLDADDRLLPEGVGAGVECLTQHPEAALAYGRRRLIDLDGSVRAVQPLVVPEDPYGDMLRHNYIGLVGAPIYRRAVFEHVHGFDQERAPAEDYDLYLRVVRRFPIASHSTVVGEYREHGANTSARADVMLRAVNGTLRAQRRYTRRDGRRRLALRAGHHLCRVVYGDLIAREITEARLKHEWARAMRLALGLFRRYPKAIVKGGSAEQR